MKRSSPRRGPNGSTQSQQSPFAPGMKIRAVSNFQHHSYRPGKAYTVVSVDTSDNTLRARDASGEEGNWIRWDDCQIDEEIGWNWLKEILPAEALDLLANFDGLDQLRLNNDVRTHLILGIPDLKNRILAVREQMEISSMNKVTATDSDPDDDDDSPNFLDFM